VLSTRNPAELRRRADQAGMNSYDLGKVGGQRLTLEYEGIRVIDIDIDDVESAWRQALPKLLS
jgi:hypothetical protein